MFYFVHLTEIPHWLHVYTRGAPEHDHKLKV